MKAEQAGSTSTDTNQPPETTGENIAASAISNFYSIAAIEKVSKILTKIEYLEKGLEMARDDVDFMGTGIFDWDKDPENTRGNKLKQEEVTEPRDYIKELLYPLLVKAVNAYDDNNQNQQELLSRLSSAVEKIPIVSQALNLETADKKYTREMIEKAKNVSKDERKKNEIKDAIAQYKLATAEPETATAPAVPAVVTEATATATAEPEVTAIATEEKVAKEPVVAPPAPPELTEAEAKSNFLEAAKGILLQDPTSDTQFDTEYLLTYQKGILKEATELTDESIETLVDNLKSKLAAEIEMAKIKAAIEKRGKPMLSSMRQRITGGDSKKATEKAQTIQKHLEGSTHGLDANEHLNHLKRLSATLESGNQKTKEKLEALNKQHRELENHTGDNKPAQS